MERNPDSSLGPYDWYIGDRLAYSRLSYRSPGPFPDSFIRSNTFCVACLNVTRGRRASEFTSIRQRHAYYDFMSYVFEYTSIPDRRLRDIKFFHATTAVTTWAALGAAEGIVRSLVLSSETINVLSEINRILFEDNMFVIYCLLFSPDFRFPFAFVNNSPCVVHPREISCFEFDLQMVRFEQSIVETYITSHSDQFTDTVRNEINATFNPGIMMGPVSAITGGISRRAMKMAKDELGVSELNFMNYRHRTAIGFAAVHVFHRKQSDYPGFLRSIGYIQ
jgi:hypothetical protein